jgi:hypothetical protein
MYMDALAFGNRIEPAEFVSYGDIEAIEAAIIRAIVRGEQSVGTLNQTTVRITARGLVRRFGSPAMLFLSVTPRDLADGLFNLKADPKALADWARFILVASDLFAFEDRHTDYRDRLLRIIWDLALGTPVGAPVIQFAHAVRSRLSNQ